MRQPDKTAKGVWTPETALKELNYRIVARVFTERCCTHVYKVFTQTAI
jgi:hypothetical protein